MSWKEFDSNKQTFCHLWASRYWPPGPRVGRAGLPGWREEKGPERPPWCCWAPAWSPPPLCWRPRASQHTRWRSPPSAARSKPSLSSNRRETEESQRRQASNIYSRQNIKTKTVKPQERRGKSGRQWTRSKFGLGFFILLHRQDYSTFNFCIIQAWIHQKKNNVSAP